MNKLYHQMSNVLAQPTSYARFVSDQLESDLNNGLRRAFTKLSMFRLRSIIITKLDDELTGIMKETAHAT